MQTQRRVWKCFQRYNVVKFVVSFSVVVVLVGSFLTIAQQANVVAANAHSVVPCSRANDAPLMSASTSSGKQAVLLADTGMEVYVPDATYATFNFPYTRCPTSTVVVTQTATPVSNASDQPAPPPVSHGGKQQRSSAVHHGHTQKSGALAQTTAVLMRISADTFKYVAGNVFPFGQCTWWADQRYHQLHGIFVPWTMNANASQWVARAYEFGWHVSARPTPGSIIVLQAGVQGAFALGHVGIVEQVLNNGNVIVSSMNWGNQTGAVTQSSFSPGPGVAFLSL